MMTLFASTSSPYARKTRIVARERNLDSQIETVLVSPFENGPTADRLRAANPLNKIPTLLLPSGEAIYDSRVICEYLDGLGDAPPLLPPGGSARVKCLTRVALADGILDCAFNLVMERRRPQELQSADWTARWDGNIRRALAILSATATPDFDLGVIGAICAVDYLEFRLADRDYDVAAVRSALQSFHGRPSAVETRPRD